MSASQSTPGWPRSTFELSRLAELRITGASGLDAGPIVTTVPLDRVEWVSNNLRSFAYLVEPIAGKLSGAPSGGPMDAVLKQLTPALLGMQMGVVVGASSQQVLGQFDVGLPSADQGSLYLVIPNIEAFTDENSLDPKQVRLWAALREVAHHVQFSRPWVRDHIQTLVNDYIESMEVDTSAFGSQIEDFNNPDRLQEMMEEGGGLPSFITGPQVNDQLDALRAFMAIIEGHSEFLLDRAAAELLPDLSAMRSAMSERRSADTDESDVLGRILGADLQRAHYDIGADFCREVESRWGDDALRSMWEGPENLPTLSELSDATGWAARVLLEDPFRREYLVPSTEYRVPST